MQFIKPQYTEQELQNVIRHTLKDPTKLDQCVLALYKANVSTLRRQIAGIQLGLGVAHYDKEAFSPAKEQAISEHRRAMADYRFQICHDLF